MAEELVQTAVPAGNIAPRLQGAEQVAGEPAPWFPMTHKDFRRIYDSVNRLKNPISQAQPIAVAAVTLGLSIAVTDIPYWIAFAQLSASTQASLVLIGPTMVLGLGAICFSFGLYMLWIARKVDNFTRRDASQICEDMDGVYEEHRAALDKWKAAQPPSPSG